MITPKLLVSVRSVSEAKAALAGGADVIDVKEPSRGSLGAASVEVIEEIAEFIAGRAAVSAAYGELLDIHDVNFIERQRHSGGSELMAGKIGLAGCLATTDWEIRWQTALASLPAAQTVAVVYADHQNCNAPDPGTVVKRGTEFGCSFLLVDTHSKDRSLTQLLRADSELGESLDTSISTAQRVGMQVVIAGSLQAKDFKAVVDRWQPNYVAVRGAACTGDRTGEIDQARLEHLRRAMESVGISSCDTPLTD